MTLQEIYDSLNIALNADKSSATEMAMAKLRDLGMADPNGEVVAVLSTTVLPVDGLYAVTTIEGGFTPNISGVPHYCGHPTTAAIIEDIGAVKANGNLFPGLEVGQQAMAVAIAQGKSTRARDGFTSPHQDVVIGDLQFRVIRRVA